MMRRVMAGDQTEGPLVPTRARSRSDAAGQFAVEVVHELHVRVERHGVFRVARANERKPTRERMVRMVIACRASDALGAARPPSGTPSP